jgi:hypothetical protein
MTGSLALPKKQKSAADPPARLNAVDQLRMADGCRAITQAFQPEVAGF